MWGFKTATPQTSGPSCSAFLVVVVAEVLAVVVLSAVRLGELNSSNSDAASKDVDKQAFAYTLCVLVNALFVLVYLVHGTLREQVLELAACVIASLLLGAYLAYSYWGGHFTDPVSLARLVVGLAFQPFNIGFGVPHFSPSTSIPAPIFFYYYFFI